jgi:hypothetical protein
MFGLAVIANDPANKMCPNDLVEENPANKMSSTNLAEFIICATHYKMKSWLQERQNQTVCLDVATQFFDLVSQRVAE